jgi:hypothetical protein
MHDIEHVIIRIKNKNKIVSEAHIFIILPIKLLS